MTTGSVVPVPYTGNREPLPVPAVPEPLGTSGNQCIQVVTSSEDDAPVPHLPGAERLADRARRAGWSARLTYALARVPAAAYADPKRGGEIKKPAYDYHTVAVRLARPRWRGWALWARVDDGPWGFDHAYLRDAMQAMTKLGLREFTKRLEL